RALTTIDHIALATDDAACPSALRRAPEEPPEVVSRAPRLPRPVEPHRVDEGHVPSAADVVGYHEAHALGCQRIPVLGDREHDLFVLEARVEFAPRYDRLIVVGARRRDVKAETVVLHVRVELRLQQI